MRFALNPKWDTLHSGESTLLMLYHSNSVSFGPRIGTTAITFVVLYKQMTAAFSDMGFTVALYMIF